MNKSKKVNGIHNIARINKIDLKTKITGYFTSMNVDISLKINM